MVTSSAGPPSTIPPQAIIEVCLCHHARRTTRAITRVFDDVFAPLRLKATQFNMLAAIAARESGSATEIAQVLAMDRTTLSRNLKPLREAGWVTVSGGAGRRPATLTLTALGQALLNQGIERWQSAQSSLTARLGAGQTGLLLQSLEAAGKALAP
jgi:DNA-binding MarR family transcriptional regulator